MKIGFLGLGAMGSRMTARLVGAGHDVTVWNRSERRATPEGATRVATPGEAADGAEAVFAMVRDDPASQSVWLGPEGALARLHPEAVGVECSTLSLPHLGVLSKAFGSAGRIFVDAPLAGSRPQAEAGALIFFTGGDAEAVERIRPALGAMGSAIHHAGATGAGALTKLMVNALFGAQIAVIAELVGFAEASGHGAEKALRALLDTPVAAPIVKANAPAMLENDFPAAFPIDLAAKDFGLLTASASDVGSPLPIGAAVETVFQAARAEGLGDLNINGVVRRYRP